MGIRLLWLLMLFACSISLGAQMPAGPLVINNSDANLRMAPDESVRVITALPSSNRRLSIRPVGDSTELGSEPLEYGGWVNGPAQRWFTRTVFPDSPAPSVPLMAAASGPPRAAPQTAEAEPMPVVSKSQGQVERHAITPRKTEISVSELHLTMEELDARVLFRKDPGDRSTFPVTVRDQREALHGRIEVMGGISRLFLKKSLMIKLQKGQLWRGKREISLNAMTSDPSAMRDWLSWDLIGELGMVRPEVTYARLYINRVYSGLYLVFERIEAPIFDRYGLGADGQLFHPNDEYYCGNLGADTLVRLHQCWLKYAPRDDDHAPLRELISAIDATPAAAFDRFLEENFDVDSVINWLVVNTLTSNNDTYNKNYFLYRAATTGKWLVIPWHSDITFGRNGDSALSYPRNILNDNFQYYYSPELGSPGPLKQKVLQNPQLYERFKTRLSHTLGVEPDPFAKGGFGWFEPDVFEARIDLLENTIGQDSEAGPYDTTPRATFAEHVEGLRFYNLVRYHYLKKLVLEPTVYGTPHWLPYSAYAPLQPADPKASLKRKVTPQTLSDSADLRPGANRLVMIEEGSARPIGVVTVRSLDRPARLRMEVETEREPTHLPPRASAARCVQRNWFVDLKTPFASLRADLILDYLQESSLHHERGAALVDEAALQLWLLQGGQWRQLPAVVNTYANTLRVSDLEIPHGQLLRFVACEVPKEG